MHWLSFLVGALVGWLICWLLDRFFCRQRRVAVEADLSAELEQCRAESSSLRAQLSGYSDLQSRLDNANAEIAALKAQLDGMTDVQVRLDGANAELDSLKAQLADMKGLKTDLVSWKAQATQKSIEIERLNAELAARAGTGAAAAVAGLVATADTGDRAGTPGTEVADVALTAPETGSALAAAAAEPGEPDDLTVIEGIGPKIGKLLNQDGLDTFAQLAAATVERLQAILTAAGPRFRLADPATWPEQAAFARDGRWDALQAFQETLKGGRVV